MRTHPLQIWLDLDGCFADFCAGALELGIDVSDPDHDTKDLWERIGASPVFWGSLPLMDGAQVLWEALRHHSPVFLTGTSSDIKSCEAAKREWVARHFGEDVPCVVVRRRDKPFYARPGDILIDDSQDNIERWEKVGGIGIHHVGIQQTLNVLKQLGVMPDGTLSEGLQQEVESRRALRKFRRRGYTGYRLTERSQKDLARRFPPRWFTPDSRISCHHVTRSFPAGDDITLEPRPTIEVVGEFVDETLGCHAVVVAVDSKVLREDGNVYHVTITYDQEAGPKSASDILTSIVEASGGDVGPLYNLNPDARMTLDGEFKLIRPWDRKLNSSAVRRFPDTMTVAEHVFASGEVGTITLRRSGDEETAVYKDAQGRLHNDEGPAVIRKKASSGEVLHQLYACHGEELDAATIETDPPVTSLLTP